MQFRKMEVIIVRVLKNSGNQTGTGFHDAENAKYYNHSGKQFGSF